MNRRQSRQGLQKFTEHTTPTWKPGKLHRAICDQLDRVERGEVDRLMLLCPPQHGKSTSASKRYPAYTLGRKPGQDVVSASATLQLAEEFGREVRNCISSPEYRQLFPGTLLAEDSQAKGRWHTSGGGSYYAVGVGGALMGRGADKAIIDDPFATWEDAQSPLARERVWDWYLGTVYNRVRPGGAIVLIQHRMAEDDLAGRLIDRQKAGADKWEIVEFPAHLDNPPWPERYDRAALERIRANTDERKWAALYMQNPAPEDGTFFRREWFKWYDPRKAPSPLNVYLSSDFAVTEDGGDFTELSANGVDSAGNLYLGLDWWWGQTTADKWIERICDQILAYAPLGFFGESGVIRRSIEPILRRRMDERNAMCRMEWITRTHDKATMARPLQARASMGKVYLPDNEAGHRFLSQALMFPAGKHDDAVDCAAILALAMDQAHPAIVATKEPEHFPSDFG